MWSWLPKNTHERSLIIVILVMSIIAHVSLLTFFFCFKDRSSKLSLFVVPEMLNGNIEFTFAPVQKHVRSGSHAKAAAPVQKKASQKADALRDKALRSEKTQLASLPEKKAAKEPAKKAEGQKIAPKKEPEKKIAEPIKELEKKQETPKQVQEKIVPPTLKEPVTPEEPIVVGQQSDTITLATNDTGVLQQQIGIHERGLIDEYIALQQDIVTQWAPPPGIAQDCACQVTLLIDHHGAVKAITVEKSSGVLMFDTAARAAIAKIEMPRWTWGKTLTITFNQ